MQFLATIAAAATFIAAAAAAPPTQHLPNGFVKRDVGQVTICTGANSTGECKTETYPTNQCIVLPEPYNKNLGTIIPDHGNLVRVTDTAESCTTHGDLFLEWPGSSDFHNYEDKDWGSSTTSFLIQQCDNCA